MEITTMSRYSNFAGSPGQFFLLMAVMAIFVSTLSGCTSTYGQLQSSYEVTDAFKNNQVLTGYQYYYSGFQRMPNGIIGIDQNYRLYRASAGYWKPISMTPDVLSQWTYGMQHVYSLPPRGAWILDQNGNRVGFWYSSQYWATIKMRENNEVAVLTPKPPDLSGIP